MSQIVLEVRDVLCLAGRCADDTTSRHNKGTDRGRLYHSVPQHSGVAICGATYGRRSAGWSTHPGTEVTCPRCLKKLAREARESDVCGKGDR